MAASQGRGLSSCVVFTPAGMFSGCDPTPADPPWLPMVSLGSVSHTQTAGSRTAAGAGWRLPALALTQHSALGRLPRAAASTVTPGSYMSLPHSFRLLCLSDGQWPLLPRGEVAGGRAACSHKGVQLTASSAFWSRLRPSTFLQSRVGRT